MGIALAACAPRVDGPIEQQRAVDREDSAVLAAELELLPNVVRAEVDVHRPARELDRVQLADASVVLLVTGRADDAARAAAQLVPGARVTTYPVPASETLASVGPFHVAPESRTPLKLVLAGLLAVIAALAAALARASRRRAT